MAFQHEDTFSGICSSRYVGGGGFQNCGFHLDSQLLCSVTIFAKFMQIK